MKSRSICWLVWAAPLAVSAAPFQNLGFDETNWPDSVPNPIPGTPLDFGPGDWVRPGWSSSPQSAVGYNYTQLFNDGWSSILDRNYRNNSQPADPPQAPVVGNFSLGIWPPATPVTGGVLQPFVLRQTGDVPADAKSLRFLYEGDNLRVSLGGVSLTVFPAGTEISGDPNVPLFSYSAVDVSAFAGKTAELKFEFRSFGNYPGRDGGQVPGWPDAKMHVLDDLSFSPLPAVPEPSTWAMFTLGLAATAWRCHLLRSPAKAVSHPSTGPLPPGLPRLPAKAPTARLARPRQMIRDGPHEHPGHSARPGK